MLEHIAATVNRKGKNRMANLDIVQGYRVPIAKKYSIAVAIVYEKVQFWAERGGRNDGWVWKSYADMSDETALSTKQISKAYEILRDEGVIETKVMKVGKTPTLHFRLVQKAKSMESAKRQSPINTEKTQNTNMELLVSVISLVNKKEKPTADRLRKLNARLKDGYTPFDIERAAVALSESEWHKDNKQMSIDNLLAPSKFGRWYQASQSAPSSSPQNTPVVTDEYRARLRREEEEEAEEIRRQAREESGGAK